jgi:hypothetical protein
MDAPIRINSNNTKNNDNQLVPYNTQCFRPQVAINEELVHGALTWTTKFQLHLASHLGTEVINVQNVPPQLQKVFSFMEAFFSRVSEEEGNQMIAEAQPAIEMIIAKKKEEELRKLTYAGVSSREQLKHKEAQVYSLVDKAIVAYLANPRNIENRVNIDFAMARTKWGFLSEENQTIILSFWKLVDAQPEYYKKAVAIVGAFMGIATLNSVEGLVDESSRDSSVHIILKVMEAYTNSAQKVKDDIRKERDASQSASDVVMYDYILLRAEIVIPALVWELIKSMFADKIKRAEELLESFVEITKKHSLSNIAMFQSLVDSGFDNIGFYQNMVIRDLNDHLEYIDELKSIEKLNIYKARIGDVFGMLQVKLNLIWVSYDNVLNSQEYISEEKAKTEADMRKRALEILVGSHVMNPIEARQILAAQPDSEKTLFKAFTIINPMFETLINKEAVPLLEEIHYDLSKENDPLNNFVKLYEERDQRVLALFGSSKVEEVPE